MARFEEGYDAQAAWEERLEAFLPQPAQVRAAAAMDSAKVSVLGKGTRVKVLERAVVGNGTVRVRVSPDQDSGLGGWLSAKVLSEWRTLPPSRGEVKECHFGWSTKAEFSLWSGKTLDGVHFLRGVVGAAAESEAAEPTVLLFLHGGGYNLGVWIPVVEHLHAECVSRRERYEVVLIDWIGHGRGRRLPGEAAAADRFDIAELGPRDVFSVLDDDGADDARFRTTGRRVVGVGHSNGGMILALAEQRRPGAFAGLVLCEPIIYRPPLLRRGVQDAGQRIPRGRRRVDAPEQGQLQESQRRRRRAAKRADPGPRLRVARARRRLPGPGDPRHPPDERPVDGGLRRGRAPPRRRGPPGGDLS